MLSQRLMNEDLLRFLPKLPAGGIFTVTGQQYRTCIWLCRDRLKIILQPSDTRHKFRLCTGFTAGRPPLPFVRVTDFDFTGQKGSGRPLRIPSRRAFLCTEVFPKRRCHFESVAAQRHLIPIISSFYDGRWGLRRPSRRSTVRLRKWHSSSDRQWWVLHRKMGRMAGCQGRAGRCSGHPF